MKRDGRNGKIRPDKQTEAGSLGGRGRERQRERGRDGSRMGKGKVVVREGKRSLSKCRKSC